MRIEIHPDRPAAARAAAEAVAAVLRERPDAVLGLATGGTMVPVYEALVALHRAGLSFAGAASVNLDEYVGLPPGHPQSYRRYMERHLFGHVDIDPARTHLPPGGTDPGEAARRYRETLAALGPPDIQLLGLGRNGHIGFNEPGSAFGSGTRPVRLSASTLRANARFFGEGERQPEQAITMGIATILRARRILLVACGTAKAGAVRAMVEGPVTEDVPATALRGHGDAAAILDEESAGALGTAARDAAGKEPPRPH